MQDQETPLSPENKAAPELVENVADTGAETQTPVADVPGPDTLPSLPELPPQAELNAAEHHDAWLRAKAETENVRRRAQDDIAKASKFAADKFAQAMLPVKDSLEAALATENATLQRLIGRLRVVELATQVCFVLGVLHRQVRHAFLHGVRARAL